MRMSYTFGLKNYSKYINKTVKMILIALQTVYKKYSSDIP